MTDTSFVKRYLPGRAQAIQSSFARSGADSRGLKAMRAAEGVGRVLTYGIAAVIYAGLTGLCSLAAFGFASSLIA